MQRPRAGLPASASWRSIECSSVARGGVAPRQLTQSCCSCAKTAGEKRRSPSSRDARARWSGQWAIRAEPPRPRRGCNHGDVPPTCAEASWPPGRSGCARGPPSNKTTDLEPDFLAAREFGRVTLSQRLESLCTPLRGASCSGCAGSFCAPRSVVLPERAPSADPPLREGRMRDPLTGPSAGTDVGATEASSGGVRVARRAAQ